MYTLREFRAKTKEAFDKANKEPVEIIRNGVSYWLTLKADTQTRLVDADKEPMRVHKDDLFGRVSGVGIIKPCKHGADPKFCRFTKNGKPCK